MTSSESENESECFESAAESLDEEDDIPSEVKPKVIKSLRKSESEVEKPAVSSTEILTNVEAKDDSNSSFKYRKRPERVKRLSSKSPTRVTPNRKSSGNDSIFSTENIMQPDVLFQDITTNLSRNINKSLNTLQQKSSNVKDLILSSLPVSSPNVNEVFSYDDYVPEDSGMSKSEEHSKDPEENVPSVTLEKPASACSSGNDITKPEKSIETDENKVKKPPDLVENLKTDTNEKNDLEIKSDDDSSCNESDNVVKEDKIDLENSQETDVSQMSSETLKNDIHDEKNIKEDTSLTSPSLDKPSDKNTANYSVMPANEIVEENLTKSDGTDSNDMVNKDIKGVSECNVEELKTALMNIVKEEVATPQTEETEVNSPVDEVNNLKEMDESPKDGWDDFDFSDNEIENCESMMGSKKESKEPEKKILEKHVESVSTEVIKPEVINSKASESSPKVSEKPKIEQKKEETARNVSVKGKDSLKESIEKEEKVEETTDDKDGWDWDGWDDNPEDQELNKETESNQIFDNRQTERNEGRSSQKDKWSGWESFGQKQEEKQGNWGIGSWGVNMLLNKATAVTQGISNVLEAGLGAPDPETLARMEKMREEREERHFEKTEESPTKEVSKKNSLTDVTLFPDFGITNLVAGVTSKIVEHSKIQEIGSKVISGGLDTLETFGKKTMEVLQEGDPGLKHKRALLLGNNKPVLSQVLREAQEKADRELKKVEEKELAKKCHFETLFDDFQGMVHLEALEMLSTQCELKLEQIKRSLNAEEREDLDGILEEVVQLCSLEDFDMDVQSSMMTFKKLLEMAVAPLENEISVQKIIQIHNDVTAWLNASAEEKLTSVVIHQKVVSTLAELTAATVHQFHKAGELLAVKECRKTVEEVDALSKLTGVLCMEIGKLCEKFNSLLLSSCKKELNSEQLTILSDKIKTGMKNSTCYIRQAFDLLIPVVQVGAAV